MNFIILLKKDVDVKGFVDFWQKTYKDPKEKNYTENINEKDFDKKALLILFEWKNGSRLSNKKEISFNKKIASKLKIINSMKNSSEFNLDEFLEEFKEVSLIWKIFLLHIMKPNRYPIFDQHVYRAFYYIKHSKIKELPNNDKEKEDIYFNQYLPFFKEIQKGFTVKEADESLWSFGKFLKSEYI